MTEALWPEIGESNNIPMQPCGFPLGGWTWQQDEFISTKLGIDDDEFNGEESN